MGVVDLFNQIAENKFGFFQQVRSVSDVMTSGVKTLTLDDTVQSAREFMRLNKVHHAPVVEPDSGAVVGVISDRDVLREYPHAIGTGSEGDHDQEALRTSCSQFLTRNPVWCAADEPIGTAMSLMLDHHIDSVLVGHDSKLAGIVTPRDFIRTLQLYHHVCTRDDSLRRLRLIDLDLRNGMPLDQIFATGAQTARDVMTKDVLTIQPHELVRNAMRLMQERSIRHLPVVGDNKLVGMLSDREILLRMPVPGGRTHEGETRFRESLYQTADRMFLQTPVTSLMADVDPVSPNTLLTDVMRRLLETTLSGVPVVRGSGKEVCGIVTTSEILRVFRVVMQIGTLADESAAPVTVATVVGTEAPVAV